VAEQEPDRALVATATLWAVSLATFKDFCLDATDASTLGSFWSEALGLELHAEASGDTFLTGASTAHTIWINQVPEPKTVKHRIHRDVHGSSAENLEAIGASAIDDESFPWIVMADPEGGEFCLFVRKAPPAYRLYEIAIDCADHENLSRWWAAAIGGNRASDPRGFSYIEQIPVVPFGNLSFSSVSEPKTTKNRIHFDLFAESVDGLLGSGATLLRERDDEIRWDVLADPEGNEFCVFSSH